MRKTLLTLRVLGVVCATLGICYDAAELINGTSSVWHVSVFWLYACGLYAWANVLEYQ